ncbi:MAG TPA: hypothetical protein PLA65_01720 [Spirochaetota bacterium]|nr:hypothetical protein [Spirochaetota bacterium]HOD14151.1 hypothetical protein [Spirochaetota bacterium]HPG49196.1 hypothetical protein [Spirochaetota bacterium]HPN10752.1 hypothetical protein [Spirochaetota bacterium]
MFTILLLLISLLWSAGIIILKKKSGAAEILETILAGMMLFCVGIGGLFAFTGHAFMADQVAAKIGWPAGSPFQFEVAVANLAFGILGLMSVRFRNDFRLATAVGYAVFLLGAAAGHIREIILKGNNAEYNAGAFLVVGDIFVPLALLALVIAHRSIQHSNNRQ